MGELSVADVLDRAVDRERELAVHADLYERIYTFLEGVSKETYAAYDSGRDRPEFGALMSVHRTVLQIKTEYRGLVSGNRVDVEIYAKLRQAAALAREQGK